VWIQGENIVDIGNISQSFGTKTCKNMICNIKNILSLNRRIIGLAYFLEDGTGEGSGLG